MWRLHFLLSKSSRFFVWKLTKFPPFSSYVRQHGWIHQEGLGEKPPLVGDTKLLADPFPQTYAIAYMGYCVGNIVGAYQDGSNCCFCIRRQLGEADFRRSTGPQTFKANQAPKYTSGVAAMLACYAIAMALLAVFWAYCAWLNKKKATQLAAYEASRVGKEDLIESWQDQTDYENPHFHYTT